VLSPLAGVYIDRIGPRAGVVTGYCAAACAALGLAAARSLAELAIAAAVYGCARAVAGPAASALPPRIVAADDLLAANALLGAASAGQVAGPLAASAALALSGFPAAFVVDSATYLIGAAVVAPLPLRPRPGRRRRPGRGSRRSGSYRPEDVGQVLGSAPYPTRLELRRAGAAWPSPRGEPFSAYWLSTVFWPVAVTWRPCWVTLTLLIVTPAGSFGMVMLKFPR